MKRLTGAERDQFWEVLFKDYPETADGLTDQPAEYFMALQAMFSLVFHGEDAVAWLRRKMGPPLDLKKVPQLIEDLENPQFEAREGATRELERIGHPARFFLEGALAQEPPAETKRRVSRLLAKLKETAVAYELRQMRIIDVLEHINTASSRELLQLIADGKFDPAYAAEAKQALQRARGIP